MFLFHQVVSYSLVSDRLSAKTPNMLTTFKMCWINISHDISGSLYEALNMETTNYCDFFSEFTSTHMKAMITVLCSCVCDFSPLRRCFHSPCHVAWFRYMILFKLVIMKSDSLERRGLDVDTGCLVALTRESCTIPASPVPYITVCFCVTSRYGGTVLRQVLGWKGSLWRPVDVCRLVFTTSSFSTMLYMRFIGSVKLMLIPW